jgi:hypothetical protein
MTPFGAIGGGSGKPRVDKVTVNESILRSLLYFIVWFLNALFMTIYTFLTTPF